MAYESATATTVIEGPRPLFMRHAPVETRRGPAVESPRYDPQRQRTLPDVKDGFTTACFRTTSQTGKNEADRVMDD